MHLVLYMLLFFYILDHTSFKKISLNKTLHAEHELGRREYFNTLIIMVARNKQTKGLLREQSIPCHVRHALPTTRLSVGIATPCT
jgi:hypothetical protein